MYQAKAKSFDPIAITTDGAVKQYRAMKTGNATVIVLGANSGVRPGDLFEVYMNRATGEILLRKLDTDDGK